ncbi:MAG: amino acid adenylation domain-containing protein [Opitutaceae bacterium]|nr:amino acid adenylation domain-containing protein [Opitutaceae bacterium]
MPPTDPRANVEDVYELSPLQEGFLFHHLRDPAGGDYVEQMTFLLEGALDLAAFERAWQVVVDRHPALRTSFQWEGLEKPLQIVHRQVAVPLVTEDWGSDGGDRLDAFLATDREKGFDLAAAPLMRLTVASIGAERWQVIWTHSHLLLDGWSLPLVLQEVLAAYAGGGGGLPVAPKYRDFVRWLRQGKTTGAAAFWREELAGFEEPTPLPLGSEGESSPQADGPAGEELLIFSETETARLKVWAAGAGITLNTLAAGAWALVLARMSGKEEVVFGSTVSGRPPELPQAEKTVGLFINTIPLRFTLAEELTPAAWLAEQQARMAQVRTHEHTPLAEVRRESAVPTGRPLFETLYVFENYPGAGEAGAALPAGLRLAEARGLERTHYPLTLVAAEDAGRLAVKVLFDGKRVQRDDAVAVAGRMELALQQLTATGDGKMAAVDLVTTEESARLVKWSGEAGRTRSNPDWVEQFLTVAEREPNSPALVQGGDVVSYGELARRSAAVARRLRAAGVGPETVVALGMGRSLDWAVAGLGVLRAGGAYLPVDPAYPQARIDFMLADSGASQVLARREFARRMGPDVTVWEDLIETTVEDKTYSIDGDVEATAAAYVIYTSGSTGQPKGVVVSRGAWANLAAFQREELALGGADRVLQFASTSFDASVWELSLALGSGAALVGATAEALRPGEPLAETLKAEGVTCALLPPSTVAHLPVGSGESLRCLIVGGEACKPGLVEAWSAGSRRVINAYGPSENAVVATWAELTAADEALPIGRPIPGTMAYVVGAGGGRVPPGVPGELWLGGASLASGYLGRPELTATAFGSSPWARGGERLYRTGDLVRWDQAGRLEFLGRIDQQVKVRGFRVELGEIETVMSAHPGVTEGAVTVGGEDQLMAWVVVAPGADADEAGWREWAAARLPAHMVPGVWVTLASLPMTPNGKVDKTVLVADATEVMVAGTAAAGSPLVAWMAGVFSEVLARASVKPTDDFFELGGHSLLATKLLSRVREYAAPGLPLRAVFEAPTPAGLAERVATHRVGRDGAEAPPALVAREGTGPVPASFGQQRFWLLERLQPGNAANHLQLAVRVRGELDGERLRTALAAVQARHEPLRVGLAEVAGEVVQVPMVDAALPLIETESGDWAEQLVEDAATAFDFERGPLWRVRWIKTAAGEQVLGFTFHHVIFDGWSEGVLVRELVAAYAGRLLASPVVGYGDFSAWQRTWLAGGELERQMTYWRAQLADVSALDFPTDRTRPAVQTYAGGVLHTTLGQVDASAVAKLARGEGATLFMVLLAAWEAMLSRHTGQEDFAVGTPIAGRTRTELEGMIGLFLNTLVLRADITEDPTFAELLGRVRTTTLDAYAHQDAPFEQIVEALNPPRDLSRPPLFQTLLVVQNAPVGEAEVEGVTLEALRPDGLTAKYELTLAARERAGDLELSLEFNEALFDRVTAVRLLARFVTLLMAAVAEPKRRVSGLPMMAPTEAALLRQWNETQVPLRSEAWLHEPADIQDNDGVVLRFEGKDVLRRDFDMRVAQLAARLRARGVRAESLVGVYLERSVDLVVVLHAVVKTGGAYVPLDPSYPQDRVDYMLRDSGARWVVSTGVLKEKIQVGVAEVVDVADRSDTSMGASAAEVITGGQSAYMIYTSGSTGQPKGALNTHAAIRNRLDWMQATYPLMPTDRVLQKTPYSFDVSVWEFFWPLRVGATLVVAPPDVHKDPAQLTTLIATEGITTVHFVPSMLQAWLDAPGLEQCVALRQVICSGEALPRETAERFFAVFPHVALHNLYGPTEAAVDVTAHACRPGDVGPVALGRPIENISVHIRDSVGEAAPIGVPGEIYLGGLGLGRGYYGRSDLTAERWVPAAESSSPGERWYRTGDRGRWRADGELEYLGRMDFQVKLRGFRIELGEIESRLREQPAVSDAVVVLREDTPGDTRLVAYIVGEVNPPEVAILRSELEQQVPDYMVPTGWVFLESWPLSPAGKLDRRALPAPDPMNAGGSADAIPPQGPVEELVAALWSELLGIETVGRADNFFELGGHSLLATQLISRLREQLQIELPLMRFFEAPTVEGCARELVAQEPVPGHAEQYARARLRLRSMTPEEKARLLAKADT